jgi:hypothetical protein
MIEHFGYLSGYFAPSALVTEVNLSWAVGPGFYISRPWRFDARFLVRYEEEGERDYRKL